MRFWIGTAPIRINSWNSIFFSSIVISVMAAFGAGALIAALAVELVAPTVLALADSGLEHAQTVENFYSLLIGLIFGGILFVLLDQLVNAKGGFLRKTVGIIRYLSIEEKKRNRKLIDSFSIFKILQNISSEHCIPSATIGHCRG